MAAAADTLATSLAEWRHRTSVMLARTARRVHVALSPTGARVQRLAAAAVSRPALWALFVGCLFALPLAKSMRRELPAPPPALGQVPAFALVTEHAATLRSEDLRARTWVGEFTTLDRAAANGARTALLVEIQHRLRNMGDSARMLSISVAPADDTPPRLRAHARAHHANPYLWSFATGPTGALHEALSTVLRERRPELLASSTLVDSGYFVLVDPALRIRGFYPPTRAGADALIRDFGLVANLYTPEPPPAGTAS